MVDDDRRSTKMLGFEKGWQTAWKVRSVFMIFAASSCYVKTSVGEELYIETNFSQE